MRRSSLASISPFTCFVIALSACATNAPDRGAEPADTTQSAPIINGTVDGSAHPSVVSVITDQGGGYIGACSGTLIAVNGTTGYVLTAGHCVYDLEDGAAHAPTWVVIGNDYNSGSATYHTIPSGGWAKAPGWTGLVSDQSSYGNDFGMVKFNGATASMVTSPVLPPSMVSSLQVGSSLVVVGYGKTSDSTSNNNSTRYQVTMSADGVDAYYLMYHQGTQHKGTCQGDSGGPHFLNVGGTDYVSAVTSFGTGACSSSDSYNGRPSRQAIYNFIQDFIGQPTTPLTCADCLQEAPNTSCSSQAQQCAQGTPCDTLITCLNGATTPATQNACITATPAGWAPLAAYQRCAYQTACATECATDANRWPTCGFSSNDDTCTSCLDTSCCAQNAACYDDGPCLLCAIGAGTNCSTNAKLTAFSSCETTTCGTDCGTSGTAGTAGTAGTSGAAGTGGAAGAAGTGAVAGAGGTGGTGGAPAGAAGTGTAGDAGMAGSPAGAAGSTAGAAPSGSAGTAGTAGTATSAGGTGGTGSDAQTSPTSSSDDGGCSTSPNSTGSSSPTGALGALVAAAVLMSRRRR